MSAFTSLKEVVKQKYTKLVSYMLKDRFDNLELIKKVKCTTLFIHGEKDTFINK